MERIAAMILVPNLKVPVVRMTTAVHVDESECLLFFGQWLGQATSCDDCPPPVEPDPTGACCISGGCVLATNIDCFAGGGTYAGDDVACADAGCPSTCLGDANGDGEVSVNDILLVISQFGVTCP